MKKSFILLTLGFLFLVCWSCRNSDSTASESGTKIEMKYAVNLTMQDLGDGSTLVNIRNPWDTTKNLARYVLVERGKSTPSDIPAGSTVVKVPLERCVVYSGIHVSLIDELGAYNAVKGVCDPEYIMDRKIHESIKKGKIANCGQSTSPNMERIVSLRPEAILLSPYEKSDDASRFARTGISVIEMADYMETTPLGRAEWMRFYGRLFGKGATADSLFSKIEKEYNGTRENAVTAKTRPSVMFDRIYSGVWDVPTSGSVTGHLIEDAGGTNPFAEYRQSGSAHLTAEEVLIKAANSDYWLIRYLEPELTRDAMSKDNPLYAKFKPYKTGNVYGVNTLTSSYFEDGSFHPDKILKEMVRILHPELSEANNGLQYYKKL